MKEILENWRKQVIQEKKEQPVNEELSHLKIPVSQYNDFKQDMEQWAMKYSEFLEYMGDLRLPPEDRSRALGKDGKTGLIMMANGLSKDLRRIFNEFDLEYKEYSDVKAADQKRRDTNRHGTRIFEDE